MVDLGDTREGGDSGDAGDVNVVRGKKGELWLTERVCAAASGTNEAGAIG